MQGTSNLPNSKLEDRAAARPGMRAGSNFD